MSGVSHVTWGEAEERTNLGGVIGGTENEFGRTVVPRANIRHVGLVLDQDLCAAEIAQLQDAGGGVEEQILRLDVPMADALRVDVGKRAEQLVRVQLGLEDGHDCLHLVEVT